jgi:hypothetical protein
VILALRNTLAFGFPYTQSIDYFLTTAKKHLTFFQQFGGLATFYREH